MLPLSVEVVEGTEMGPIFYRIDHERDGRAWMVQQRFSTLHAMRDALHAENAELPDAAFPPKQWPLIHLWQAPCTPALPADEMEARRSGLQTYLTALSELKESWDSATVKDVLCCPAVDGGPPSTAAGSSASVQATPRASSSPTVVKAVSWMDQQQPSTTSVTEAASALLSLATSPPNRSDVDSAAAPADTTATPGASRSAAGVAIKASRARARQKASKKKRRSALVRSFDAFVSSTAASKRSGAAATEAADGAAQPSVETAVDAEPAVEVGSRGRSGSVADDVDSSPSPTGSSRGGEADTAVPAVVVSTATDAAAAVAAATATATPAAAAATSPATQSLDVDVEPDALSPRAAVTPTPQVADEDVARREVPGEMLLSAVMADVDSVVGRGAGEDTAPISDQTLLTPSAKAAYAAVARSESGVDFSREREEASAVSALALSSATEDGGNDEGETPVAGEGTESPPTPAAQKQRRSSLLGRAKRSLSSKMSGDKDKEVPLSSLGIEAAVQPSNNSPMTPGSAAGARTPGRLASFRDRARSLKGRFSTGGGSGPLSLTSAKGKGKGFFSTTAASPEGEALPPPVALPDVDADGKQQDYGMAVAFSPVSLSSPPPPPDVGVVEVNSGTFLALGGAKAEAFTAAPPSPGGD